MTVEIRAIGFGSDKPEYFAGSDRCSLEISQPLTPNLVIAASKRKTMCIVFDFKRGSP